MFMALVTSGWHQLLNHEWIRSENLTGFSQKSLGKGVFQTKSAHVETGSSSQRVNWLKTIQLWHRGTVWLFQVKMSAPLNLKLT